MFCHCYLRRGKLYVPTVARVVDGFRMDIEPVFVASASDEDDMRHAIRDAISQGNKTIPHPGQFTPTVPKSAGLKSWSAFGRGTRLWWFYDSKEGLYWIEELRKLRKGGWEPDENNVTSLPEGTALADAIDRFVAILKEAASESSV